MVTSTSTAHVLNNRLGYWNQLTKLYLLNQTIYQLSPVTIQFNLFPAHINISYSNDNIVHYVQEKGRTEDNQL